MGHDPEVILAELTSLLRRICEPDQTDLSLDAKLEDIPGLDSLRLLQTVAHLEEHFGVEVDVAVLDDLTFVRDIIDAISVAQPADATRTA